MHTVEIPGTALAPSSLCLGTVEFGAALDRTTAFALLDAYRDAGGNFVDTAKVYGDWVPGQQSPSEKIIGEWLKRRGVRDRDHPGDEGRALLPGHAPGETGQALRHPPGPRRELTAPADGLCRPLLAAPRRSEPARERPRPSPGGAGQGGQDPLLRRVQLGAEAAGGGANLRPRPRRAGILRGLQSLVAGAGGRRGLRRSDDGGDGRRAVAVPRQAPAGRDPLHLAGVRRVSEAGRGQAGCDPRRCTGRCS